MRRWIAVLWHASFFVLAGALYFFFVLPRWFELTGAWPSGLGLSMRITCGALIGLAALPVVFTLLRTRRPEFGTPQLALTLRLWSIVLHVLAGALIVGAAISEIWVSLDAAGPTLFGIYGASAAIAVLGALTFYLAYAAELPPPPPKPLKLKSQTRGRRRGAASEDADQDAEEAQQDASPVADTDAAADVSEPGTTEPVEQDVDAVHSTDSNDDVGQGEDPKDDTPASADLDEPAQPATRDALVSNGSSNGDAAADDVPGGTLRNRRPTSKSTSRLFGRSRRGTVLDD